MFNQLDIIICLIIISSSSLLLLFYIYISEKEYIIKNICLFISNGNDNGDKINNYFLSVSFLHTSNGRQFSPRAL